MQIEKAYFIELAEKKGFKVMTNKVKFS